jgi:general secretion pathway protein D
MNCLSRRLVAWGTVLLLLAGCAAKQAFVSGEELVRQGRYDEAVSQYSKALNDDPDSQEYRMKLFDARSRAGLQHLKQARTYREEGSYLQAISEYLQASALDPSLDIAAQEMRQVQELVRAEELVSQAEGFYKQNRLKQAEDNLERALVLVPGHAGAIALQQKIKSAGLTLIDGVELDVTSTQPITLKFKNAKVKDVFNILAKLSGINFIFDEGVEKGQITVLLEDASFAQALELLLKMNDLDKRVLNPKTVILYPATKEKQKQYQDLIIQTFYLSNIDAKKAVNMLRTMLQLRKIYVHEELNALVIRDDPQVIKLAEQILQAADRADAEVVFDLELVGVAKTDLDKYGLGLSAYSIGAGLSKDGSGRIVSDSLVSGGPTENLLSSLNNLTTFYTMPSASFDFAKTLTSADRLANPKIRVKNMEKAKIHVGTREPVITVTSTDTSTTDNVQYVDVGVKLDVEADVQLDDTVVTKISLEVSSVLDRIFTTNGSVALQIQTTTAQTALTLKDGERTILGGLLEDNYSKTVDTFSWLHNIPGFNEVFGHSNVTDLKREILLSITPHIVKTLDLPKSDLTSIWSGSEDTFSAGPTFQSFAKVFDAPQNLPKPQVVPAIVPREARSSVVLEIDDKGEKPALPAFTSEAVPPTEEAAAGGESDPPQVTPDDGANDPVNQDAVPTEVPEDTMPELSVEVPPKAAMAFFSGPELVDAGDELELSVQVAEVENLFSAPMFISFDPKVLEFVEAVEGDFLRSGGSATVFTASPPGQGSGRVIVGYKQGAGGKGATGDGSLYTLRFRALEAGKTVVNLERINFRDPAGNRLRVTGEGTLVEVR